MWESMYRSRHHSGTPNTTDFGPFMFTQCTEDFRKQKIDFETKFRYSRKEDVFRDLVDPHAI